MSEELTSVEIEGLRFYPEEIAATDVVTNLLDLWKFGRRFVILSGPPGVGKTRAAEDFVLEMLAKHNSKNDRQSSRLTTLFPEFKTRVYEEVEIVSTLQTRELSFIWDICVLHPQYSYEDLIRGFRMTPTAGGLPNLQVREGILGFISRVIDTMRTIGIRSEYPLGLLIMDEINRAPLGQLFGEALYAIDRRGKAVTTPYELAGLGSHMIVPEELMILGTMNSVDRAISGFDFALRRRFVTVQVAGVKSSIEKRFETFGEAVRQSAASLYDRAEQLILNSAQTGIVPKSELVIGHAFFLPPPTVTTDDDAQLWLAQSYQFQILPTLVDYREQGLLEFQADDSNLVPGGHLLTGSGSLSSISFDDILAFIRNTGQTAKESQLATEGSPESTS